jgi:hypothetical protein
MSIHLSRERHVVVRPHRALHFVTFLASTLAHMQRLSQKLRAIPLKFNLCTNDGATPKGRHLLIFRGFTNGCDIVNRSMISYPSHGASCSVSL